jgi:hypothetical protein
MVTFAMTECLCRVTITDMKGGGHVIEVKASSLFEAVAQAIKTKGGSVATVGFRPIKVMVFEPKAEYEVRLKDFMAWLDRNSRSPRETMDRLKIREILGVKKMR